VKLKKEAVWYFLANASFMLRLCVFYVVRKRGWPELAINGRRFFAVNRKKKQSRRFLGYDKQELF